MIRLIIYKLPDAILLRRLKRYDELEFMDITKQQIIILGTGGTIAGQAENPKDSVNYTAALVDISELLDTAKVKHRNGVEPALNHCDLLTEQLVQIDSKDMTFDVWKRLLSRCQTLLNQEQVQAIVITHGTDTLEETAYFLHRMLRTEKPVILTCAMRPANALDSDATCSQSITSASNMAVRPLPGSAQGTLTLTTPCSAHCTRGTTAI